MVTRANDMTKNAATITLVAASVCATAGSLFAQAKAAEAPGPQRPNIIVVMADDMGFSE